MNNVHPKCNPIENDLIRLDPPRIPMLLKDEFLFNMFSICNYLKDSLFLTSVFREFSNAMYHIVI